MIIQCQYCPAKSASFAEAAEHFEAEHRNKDEYVALEITPDMVKPIEEDI